MQHACRQAEALTLPAGVGVSPEQVPPLATDVLNGGHEERGGMPTTVRNRQA